jgi:hypothetical protein
VAAVPKADSNCLAIKIDMRGRVVSLQAIWAGEGRPHEVEPAIAAVGAPWPEEAVVVARHLTPAALDLLRETDANWADATGNARIVGAGIVVMRGELDKRPKAREAGWSLSSIDIAEGLLAQSWPRGISTGILADITNWSPGQVSQVLQRFDHQGWTEKVGPQRGPRARRRLIDVDGLLDAWSDQVSTTPVERRFAHALVDQPMTLLGGSLRDALDDNVRWALTGWGATELMAPIMTAIPSLQIYVAEEDFFGPLSQAMLESDLMEVPEGGIVEFWSGRSEVLGFGGVSKKARLASAPRVYADLIRIGGRAEDAAQHIRQEVIDTLHRPLTVRPQTQNLRTWEGASLARLGERLQRGDRQDPYRHGWWSAAYRLVNSKRTLPLPEFRGTLIEAAGRETGWPMWSDFGSQLHVDDGVIECWLADHALDDPSRVDYWRADPTGRMFLLRGYEEDGSEFNDLQAGTALDLTIPIWRTGECVLHAARLARVLDADSVEISMHWSGLAERSLRALAERRRVLPSRPHAIQGAVEAHVEVHADAIDDLLPEVVRALVSPLYAAFDFFEPPDDIYRNELAQLRRPQ